MSEIYVVGIDGSNSSIRAAKHAADQASKLGAHLKVIHVLEWSPYSFLTPEELEERHKRRGEELERANSAIVGPILEELGSDVVTEGEVRYGKIAEEIYKYCKETGAAQAFLGHHGERSVASRIFGTVPGALVQISDIPVTIVP